MRDLFFMPKSRPDISKPKIREPEFQADWKAGPRTLAWDQLWVLILSGLQTDLEDGIDRFFLWRRAEIVF